MDRNRSHCGRLRHRIGEPRWRTCQHEHSLRHAKRHLHGIRWQTTHGERGSPCTRSSRHEQRSDTRVYQLTQDFLDLLAQFESSVARCCPATRTYLEILWITAGAQNVEAA